MHTTEKGYLETQKLSSEGNYFFVNANVRGELFVELLDENGKPIPGYTKQECIVMKANKTKQLITWKNKKSISSLKNKAVRVKFYLTNGDLFSFWVSKWETGESNGYSAGGGPGLNDSGIDKK